MGCLKLSYHEKNYEPCLKVAYNSLENEPEKRSKYYPFGLVMSGISSKALNNAPANKYKFNGIEQNNDFDLNMYDAFYRNLDPQIGRFWQIDPKPNFGESQYAAMSNNPILYSDFLGDTVKYSNDATRGLVEKFTKETIVKKNGKEVKNKNYNEAFAGIIKKLDGATDNFVFNLDPNAKEGLVSYDGTNVNITIGDPGDAYGTASGAEGILFEETKHAEQVLDGKTYFGLNSSGKWGAATNLQNEIEAKMFAADQLGVNKYYTEQQSGSNLQIPTQLGYLKYSAKTETDKMLFLRNGVQNIFVTGANGRTGTANLTGAYPTLTGAPVNNPLTQRTKTDKIFGYPPQR